MDCASFDYKNKPFLLLLLMNCLCKLWMANLSSILKRHTTIIGNTPFFLHLDNAIFTSQKQLKQLCFHFGIYKRYQTIIMIFNTD